MPELRTATVKEANQLYKAAKYRGRAQPSDLIYGLYDKQLICVARLMAYADVFLLRQLCTLPTARRQGMAKRLLLELTEQPQRTIYLFPLENLIPLYLQSGFKFVAEKELPESLVSIWQSVKKKYPNTQPMIASGTNNNEPT